MVGDSDVFGEGSGNGDNGDITGMVVVLLLMCSWWH